MAFEKKPTALGLRADAQSLNLDDIKNVAQGACFLASGGGGSLQLALTRIIPTFFDATTEIRLVGLEELTYKGDWGAVVAVMGSPLKLFDDPELVKTAIPVFQQLASMCFAFKADGRKRFQSLELMDFCLPIEIGAVNSIVPMIVANGANPSEPGTAVVVDADGTGRAVPTLPLTTYAGALELYPNVLGGNNETEPGTYFDYGSLNVQDETTLESAFMGMIASKAFGFASGLALYAASAPDYKTSDPAPNGITDALAIGRIVNQVSGADRVRQVLNHVRTNMNRTAKQIFYGKVTKMVQATHGLDEGYTIITGADEFEGQSLKLYVENENVWAELTDSNGTRPWIVGPDSTNYLPDEGDVFDNSDLYKRYEQGDRPMTSVIGIQAVGQVRGREALMTSWASQVKAKKGPDHYITPWIEGLQGQDLVHESIGVMASAVTEVKVEKGADSYIMPWLEGWLNW